MSADTLRLFVAIVPSGAVRDALGGLNEGIPRARWTPSHQRHLTLRFIGEVPPGERERIEDALAAVRVQAFFLATEKTGRFPPRGQPGVIWAGIATHPHLHQLRQQVDDQLLAAGIAFELRPFIPHITLARTTDSPAVAVAQWLKRHRDFAGPAWRVDAFHLLASTLAPAGATHELLRTFPLSLS